ncbi:hypothetical protein PR048_005854 [Dryococelus australis]|uniref:DUF7869 domain-containing protein n=1 Tax=Dryococelus australis TaxID=614101 RepID=A0ABQ9I9D4_9NEOP|nr:hypothetical protein PR048_005854 [Dryococelus australis]
MVMWVEGPGKRSSSEVISAILKLHKEKILLVNELILRSDECTLQNKNFFIVALWSNAIQRGFASKIRHRFLVSGHTFLPCDKDFSHIEKMNEDDTH